MCERDNKDKERERKEWHWTASTKNVLRLVKIKPVVLTCTPNVEVIVDNVDSSDVATITSGETHVFEAQKVYVLMEDGHKEASMALCPIHNQPVRVDVNWPAKPIVGGREPPV